MFAQRIVCGGFDGSIYVFELSTINANCNLVQTLQIIVEVYGSISGTYNVLDYFYTELNEAYGIVNLQNLSTMSRNFIEISSETFVIVDDGSNSLTIEFEGILENSNESSLKNDPHILNRFFVLDAD